MSTTAQTTLTAKQQIAARHVAEDKLSDVEIATEVGVAKRTLEYWKTIPEFKACVADITREYLAVIRQRGIAILERRVDRLNGDWLRMQAVISARARRYTKLRAGLREYPRAPLVETDEERITAELTERIATSLVPEEATTGHLIFIETPTKYGITREWRVDTALLAELRNHEQQAAKELGQWTEKAETRVRGVVTVARLPVESLSDADLDTLETIADKLLNGESSPG